MGTRALLVTLALATGLQAPSAEQALTPKIQSSPRTPASFALVATTLAITGLSPQSAASVRRCHTE